MKNKKTIAMDLFGQAIMDEYSNTAEPFYFIVNGAKKERSLDRYLRSIEDLNNIEKLLIEKSYGQILDIGCGTGNYIKKLEEKGKVIGIDISPKVIEVAQKMGNTDCVVGNIFDFKTNKKFNTITFFENNFGMATDKDEAKKLLNILSNLLLENGQILLMQKDIGTPDIVVNKITVEYKGVQDEFAWAQTSEKYVQDIFTTNGWNFEILYREKIDENNWYLARATLK